VKKLAWNSSLKKSKIMASDSITSCQIEKEKVEAVTDFILGGSKITADGDCSYKIKKALAPWKENYDKPAAATAKSLQSCPTLCDPIDGSPPGSPVPGILQGQTLEWVAISFSNAWKWKVKVKSLSCVWPQRPHGLQPTRLFHPWDFPGKSTGVGCHCLLRWQT